MALLIPDLAVSYPSPNPPSSTTLPANAWLEMVQRTVTGLRFGSVQIVVHEGRVAQIEVVEKTRYSGVGIPEGLQRNRAAGR